MSFYRKYRPQVIDEIDNASVRDQLSALLTKDRKELPHAFFFTGPKGTGKTTAARVIAKLFNCEKPTKTGPCGTCEQCKNISSGSNLDVIEMDAASNRGIDEIRQLRDRIGLTPSSSAYTIYIIDEVHMLTTEAFNALLKTLEEPPAHAVFVLATTDAHKVPATIKSRCVEFHFHRASSEELLHALERVVAAENIHIDKKGLALIAQTADGSFRDAVKLLEQLSLQAGDITSEKVSETLTLPETKIVEQFIIHLSRYELKDALKVVEACYQKGLDMKWFLTDSLRELERLLVAHAEGATNPNWTIPMITRAIRLFTTSFEEMRYSPIAQLPIEVAIVEFCRKDAAVEVVSATVTAPTTRPIPVGAPSSVVKPPSPSVSSSHSVVQPSQTPSPTPAPAPVPASVIARDEAVTPSESLGLLTLDKLIEHWPDFIAAMKTDYHSIAGVLRSSRPKAVADGIVTIEAFYKFHQEKLGDIHSRQALSDMLKKLFGEKVRVEIVLGKK